MVGRVGPQARGVFLNLAGKDYTPPVFRERLFYRWIRHPLMAGFVVAFFAAPTIYSEFGDFFGTKEWSVASKGCASGKSAYDDGENRLGSSLTKDFNTMPRPLAISAILVLLVPFVSAAADVQTAETVYQLPKDPNVTSANIHKKADGTTTVHVIHRKPDSK